MIEAGLSEKEAMDISGHKTRAVFDRYHIVSERRLLQNAEKLDQHLKAKEAALRQDLSTLRDVLDQHKADQGKYPPSLSALVGTGYLRGVPKDPFTGATTTWQEISDPVEGGVVDVFSGAEFVGTDGTPYNRW